MTIAITGATGQLGRHVIAQLLAKVPAQQVIALVRNPAKAADLGVAARAADYTHPDTLAAALAGVDHLLLISSSEVGQRTAQHRNVIEAAQTAGVKHLIYTSLLHADTSPLSLAEEHRETEALIKASGLPYTVLRNGWYTENYLGSAKQAVAAGALIGSAGDGKISSATRADFAAAAVTVLTTPGHEGRTYELAGDESFTLSQLAEALSQHSGKPVPYRNLPPADYAAALTSFGLPGRLANTIADCDAKAAKGALFDDQKGLSRLIGRPSTPLSAAVAEALR